MSKILIALYMGVVAGHDRHAQRPNYGNQRGTEGRFRQPEDDDLFPDLDRAQPVDVLPIRNTSKGTKPRLTIGS